MRKTCAVLVILMLLLSACNTLTNKADADAQAKLNSLIDTKIQSVKATDPNQLVSILDPEDKELQTESINWLKDIEINPIEEYDLKLLKLEKVSDTEYKAKLQQRYTDDDKAHELVYYNKYKLIGGKLVDAGNYFDELKQGNIVIKYNAVNKKLSEEVIGDMNKLYDENIAKWGITPMRSLVIKLYDDIEELRQSIKLSMWPCAGWYEYGESVKLYGKKPQLNRERVKQIVNHEMTHLFTVEKSSGNLAYWFSEGLASYYEAAKNQNAPKELMRTMETKLLTIDQIEAIELEKLEDSKQIMDYYNNAHLIIAFVIERYGEDKINEILTELGKLPSFTGTTSENDIHYRAYLSQVLPKVLGLQDYEAFKQQWQSEMKKL